MQNCNKSIAFQVRMFVFAFVFVNLQRFLKIWRTKTANANETKNTKIFVGTKSIACTPRSLDLSVVDFFLWGYLKDRVYTGRLQTTEELKQSIQTEITAIEVDKLSLQFT